MNLYCKEVTLKQTPAYIANMCYYRIDKRGQLVVDTWQSILYRYIAWIEGRHHYDYYKVELNKHIEKLRSHRILHFEIR